MSTDAGEHQLASIPLQYIPLSLKTLGIYQLLEKRSARSWPFDMRNDKSKCRHNWLLQRTIKTGDETAGRPWWWAASRWFLSTVSQPPEPDGRTKLNLELVFLRLNLIIYEMTFSFLLQVSLARRYLIHT